MKALDLFCGAGGVSTGYVRAGFEVVGVDIVAQPNYPYRFVQGDALTFDLSGFDFVHASPPCQRFSWLTASNSFVDPMIHPDLIAPIRERLAAYGGPYVIENVPGARLELVSPIYLAGCMFPKIRVERRRYFESNLELRQMRHGVHYPRHNRYKANRRVTNEWDDILTDPIGHWFYSLEAEQDAMDVDWTVTHDELAQMIPPAYTEWIGNEILSQR